LKPLQTLPQPHREVIRRLQSEVVPGFRWRERNGHQIAPSDMETRHVFYTLRMLWNNSAPADMRVGDYKPYRFDRTKYPPAYLTQAVQALVAELATREDMAPIWLQEFYEMMAHAYPIYRMEAIT
jgi:hypothetical protein